jgi:lipopolysaccharide export system permease protein
VRLLDKYILGQFVKYFLLSLLALVLVFTVVDVFEEVDKFIDKEASVLTVIRFYLFDLPNTVVLMTPVALLLSCFFSIGGLSRHNELTAIRSSGISVYRILLPLLLLGLASVGGTLAMNELVVPSTNETKLNVWMDGIEKKSRRSRKLTNLYYVGRRNNYYQIKAFDPARKTMDKPTVVWKTPDGHIYQRLDAARAAFRDGWTFYEAYFRQIDMTGNERMVYHDSLFLPTIDEVPEDFGKLQKTPEEMNYPELRDYVERLRDRGSDFVKQLVELHFKVSFPFANFIIILFGASLAANLRKTGFALSFATSLLICFVYWGTIQTSRSMGQNGILPPLAAAWLPNLIFLVGGCYLLRRVQR